MKNLKSDAFGILIAFFVPGIIAFFGLSFYSSSIEKMFNTFLTSNSNVGLFLLVALGGLAIGLQITAFRWILFENWICSSSQINSTGFEKIWEKESKLNAFRAAIDEHYRYHQFFGAMFFIIPEYCIGLLIDNWTTWGYLQIILIIFISLVIEIATYLAAVDSYEKLINRSNQILN